MFSDQLLRGLQTETLIVDSVSYVTDRMSCLLWTRMVGTGISGADYELNRLEVVVGTDFTPCTQGTLSHSWVVARACTVQAPTFKHLSSAPVT